MKIGAHVSIAGGLDTAIDRGEALGCSYIQTFASSPRTIGFSPIKPEIIDLYLKKKAKSQIKGHVFHGVYLINLAHENPEYVERCVESLIHYQQVAGLIGGLGTVFHVGSHKGAGLATYIDQIAQALAKVTETMAKNTWLLLENTAGQNGAIGKDYQELAAIISRVKEMGGETKNLGVALDTQHAFSAGYPIGTQEGIVSLITEIRESVGWEKLQLIHINDSMVEFGSKRDRHENLGKGTIGTQGLRRVVQNPEFNHLPFILEVPGKNKQGPGIEDIIMLKRLINDE
jgi:deoxyribonuclease IV